MIESLKEPFEIVNHSSNRMVGVFRLTQLSGVWRNDDQACVSFFEPLVRFDGLGQRSYDLDQEAAYLPYPSLIVFDCL